jgi:hypothetical protein
MGLIMMSLGNALPAQAALNLSANPADGGNTLRLGRVDGALEVSKAVKLRISTNDGKQYQIFQRLEDSLANERQTILDSQAVNSYAVGGSNASGTLYAQQNEPLRLTDQLIYTSSPDGQSDTVTLVYAVNPERINGSGNFMGRLAYTVRSLNGGGQDQVFLNVYLEASGQLKVEVAGSTIRDGIRLKYNHRSDKNDSVVVRFSGNAGEELKVYQEMVKFPQDELGRDLDAGALEFSTSGSGGELYHAAPEAVSYKKILIFKSKDPEGEFHINFNLNADTSAVKAGTYRGKINFTTVSGSGPQEFPMDVEVSVNPIFEVSVHLPPGGIRFSHILPSDPPQIQEVDVKVNTNLGKPYMVIHSMATTLTTPQGDEIKKDSFTMKMELAGNAAGKITAEDFTPVQVGEAPVFFSDSKGSPAEFKVFYRLHAYPDIKAGDYAAPIVFSLGEM